MRYRNLDIALFTDRDIQVGLREERDKLLAEKASWASTASIDNGSVASDISRGWETEKADLIKARDEALAHVKVCIS